MRFGRAGVLLLSACVWLAASIGTATACSCAWKDQEGKLSDEEFAKRRLDEAVDVVRGRIVDFRAGDETVRNFPVGDGMVNKGARVVAAKMVIASTIKGDVPPGGATILTLFGIGDCGIPHILFGAIAFRTDVILELRKLPGMPREYFVDMCGYSHVPPRGQ
jgi:hypothetical protein